LNIWRVRLNFSSSISCQFFRINLWNAFFWMCVSIIYSQSLAILQFIILIQRYMNSTRTYTSLRTSIRKSLLSCQVGFKTKVVSINIFLELGTREFVGVISTLGCLTWRHKSSVKSFRVCFDIHNVLKIEIDLYYRLWIF